MAEKYFVLRGEKTEGPFAPGEMRHFWKAGALKPDDMCARDGDPEWKPAKQIFPALRVREKKNYSTLQIVGVLLTVGGLAGAIYFTCFFDVTVAVPGGPVANFDLMNQRLIGIILTGIDSIIGAACLIAHAVIKSKS